MEIASAFKNGMEIPEIYTCLGDNVNPPFNWYSIPEGTKSFAFIFEDIDAEPIPWVHWMLFNIPATTLIINERRLPLGGTEGLANNHTFGYEGPCPNILKASIIIWHVYMP